ncbi:hypothetical protein [Tahibacter sp.]|uniref:hypothetical protein n=1 Tax=Tahibacter sp. TaxID=2056211 RepID=UPI0028C4B46C|nr:hypothetical protein [Tahibacter sp.]
MAALLAIVGSGTVVAQQLAPAVTDISVNGNGTANITLPFQWSGLSANYYRFNVVGNGYTWTITNVESGQGSARTGKTISLAGQNLPVTLTTAGLPLTGPTPTSAQYIDFAACTGPANEFCNWTAARRYRFVVDPSLAVSRSTAIATNGRSVREGGMERTQENLHG